MRKTMYRFPALPACTDVGVEGETGKDCGGVGVNVNTDVLALREGKSDGGAEVEVSEVDGAEKGIIGHH